MALARVGQQYQRRVGGAAGRSVANIDRKHAPAAPVAFGALIGRLNPEPLAEDVRYRQASTCASDAMKAECRESRTSRSSRQARTP